MPVPTNRDGLRYSRPGTLLASRFEDEHFVKPIQYSDSNCPRCFVWRPCAHLHQCAVLLVGPRCLCTPYISTLSHVVDSSPTCHLPPPSLLPSPQISRLRRCSLLALSITTMESVCQILFFPKGAVACLTLSIVCITPGQSLSSASQ